MEIPELRGFTAGDFLRAVEIYMQLAYPNGGVPDGVQRRLIWPKPHDMAEMLKCPQFERGMNKSTKAPLFALRLGNARYPHMKLQIQPWPTSVGAMLSVNTHDQAVGLDPDAPDLEAFRSLQAENQRLKEAIEAAWESAGLPTFLRYLKDSIAMTGSS